MIAKHEENINALGYADPLNAGPGCYVHLSQLTGQAQLWSACMENVVPRYMKAIGDKLASDFDTESVVDGKLRLPSMGVSVTKKSIDGYKYASVLMMGSDDSPGIPTESNRPEWELFNKRLASGDGEIYKRIKHSREHFIVIAFPVDHKREIPKKCYYVDERNKVKEVTITEWIDVKHLVHQVINFPEMAHWIEVKDNN